MSKTLQFALAMMAVGAIISALVIRTCGEANRPQSLKPLGNQPSSSGASIKTREPAACTWAGHACKTAFDYSSRCYAELKARRYGEALRWCKAAEQLDAPPDVRAMLAYNSGLVDCHLGNTTGAALQFRRSLELRPDGGGANTVLRALESLENGHCLE